MGLVAVINKMSEEEIKIEQERKKEKILSKR